MRSGRERSHRLHGIVGSIYISKVHRPVAEAANEFSEFLKSNPTDGLGQYRYGVSHFQSIADHTGNASRCAD